MFLHTEEQAVVPVSREEFKYVMSDCWGGHGHHYEFKIGKDVLPVWENVINGWTNTRQFLFLSPKRDGMKNRKENLYSFVLFDCKTNKVYSAIKAIYKKEGLRMSPSFRMKKNIIWL